MEEKKNSIFPRLLAALALIVTVVVVVIAIGSASGGGDGDSGEKGKNTPRKTAVKPKTNKKTYEVESGDTLTTIARKTGIPIARLEKLNPDLDPQALQVGQELKLR